MKQLTAVIAVPYQLKLGQSDIISLMGGTYTARLSNIDRNDGSKFPLHKELIGSDLDMLIGKICKVKIDRTIDPMHIKNPDMLMKNGVFVNFISKEVLTHYPDFIRSLAGVAHYDQLKHLSDEDILPSASYARGRGPANQLNIDRLLNSMNLTKITYMMSSDYLEELQKAQIEFTNALCVKLAGITTKAVEEAGLAGKPYSDKTKDEFITSFKSLFESMIDNEEEV